MSKDVMDAKEVAEYLGLAPSTIYKKVEHREMPFTKVGTLLRFPKWLIDEWLAKNTTHPDASLYDEFVKLHRVYHLRQFLKSSGVRAEELTPKQLAQALHRAVDELKDELAKTDDSVAF